MKDKDMIEAERIMEFQNETCDYSDTPGNEQIEMKTTNNKNRIFENGTTNFSAEQLEGRQPVLRRVVYPILKLMRCFGLYFNDSSDLDKFGVSKTSRKLWKLYALVVNLAIFLLFLKNIVGLGFVPDENQNAFYMLGINIVFATKTVGQTLYVMHLCNKEILWNFITDLETFLDKILLCKCRFVEARFVRNARWWLVTFGFFMVLCTVTNVTIMFFPNDELREFRKVLLLPLKTLEPGFFVLKVVLDLLLLAGWFLPCALTGTLIQALYYTFHEYYRYLEAQRNRGMCVKAHIKDVRKKFLELSALCSKLDNMVCFLLMISYLGDLCLVCVILRLGIYTFHGWIAKLCIFSWIIAPLFTLLFLSRKAAQLFDKGQEMFSIIQFFNTDYATLPVKMEFDMLLFHMNTEPVVMTIWKMVPLYRSIIISIFASIVTYFAVIISL